jgi:hypothetical protein
LHAALKVHWPGISIQRCTNHKLCNLEAKAPARLREELREDYRRMIRRGRDVGGEGADRVPAEVEAALSGGRGELRGSGSWS